MALAFVMCLSLLPPTVFAAGGGTVAINDTNFPDGNFQSYVRTLPGAEDNVFTQEELAAITEINCSVTAESGPVQIFVLTGIEHFTALTRLYCDNNVLTNLDLSKNTKLTDLSCNKNQLTALDVSQNTALAVLVYANNQLTSLDLSQNPQLMSLSYGNNQRAVANGTALAVMDPNFDSSKVSKIVGGYFKGGKVYFTADELTYNYDCGGGKTSGFKLIKATSVVTETTVTFKVVNGAWSDGPSRPPASTTRICLRPPRLWLPTWMFWRPPRPSWRR